MFLCRLELVGDDAYIVPRADVGIRPYIQTFCARYINAVDKSSKLRV